MTSLCSTGKILLSGFTLTISDISLTRLGVSRYGLQNLEDLEVRSLQSVSWTREASLASVYHIGCPPNIFLEQRAYNQKKKSLKITRPDDTCYGSLIYSLMQQYLLSTFCVPGTIVKETVVHIHTKKHISLCNISYILKSGAFGLPP